jgi:hypothetical protein
MCLAHAIVFSFLGISLIGLTASRLSVESMCDDGFSIYILFSDDSSSISRLRSFSLLDFP